MRTSERLRYLKQWVYQRLCQGRELKVPVWNRDTNGIDITQFAKQEPSVYLGWLPTRQDGVPQVSASDPISVSPGILIMPCASYGKYVEEKRFDRYAGVKRPQEMGSGLQVNILFSVYEPGVRLPGFVRADGSVDMTKITEGTEEGLFTLYNWMDDCLDALRSEKFIPHTDLIVEENTIMYSLYTDQSYVVDKRPIFYGFVNVKFTGYAEDRVNNGIEALLK